MVKVAGVLAYAVLTKMIGVVQSLVTARVNAHRCGRMRRTHNHTTRTNKDKYNNKKYFLIRDLSKKYETDFDIVHIICNKLNIDETNINKGSINDVVAEIKSFHEKEKKIK